MSLALGLTQMAVDDLDRTARWLDENGRSSRAFLASMWQAFDELTLHPDRWPVLRTDPRYRVRTFTEIKYRIIYEVTDTMVIIVAIGHTSRDPDYWR